MKTNKYISCDVPLMGILFEKRITFEFVYRCLIPLNWSLIKVYIKLTIDFCYGSVPGIYVQFSILVALTILFVLYMIKVTKHTCILGCKIVEQLEPWSLDIAIGSKLECKKPLR